MSIGEDVDPVVHLIAKRLDVAQTCVFRLKDGLVGDVEVEEPLLCQVVTSQLLGIFLEYLGQKGDKLLRLMPIARKEVAESDNALLFISQVLCQLSKVFFSLMR